MKMLRHIAIALLAAVVVGTGTARAASTTDFTDQWWNPAESGWGGSVFQQADTLFFLFFVYGQDNKPTWFVAVATPRSGPPAGHVVFTGEVYATTGPYFGAPFGSAPVVERKAGTITFDADSGTSATLTYTIDGTTVVKNVTRQTWSRLDLSGSYYGGSSGNQTFCGADNGFYEEEDYLEITHNADNSVTMKWIDLQKRSFTLTGVYSQSGHLGQVALTGGGDPASGVTLATGSLFEIEWSLAGITGRGHFVVTSREGSCTWDGRWGGVRR